MTNLLDTLVVNCEKTAIIEVVDGTLEVDFKEFLRPNAIEIEWYVKNNELFIQYKTKNWRYVNAWNELNMNQEVIDNALPEYIETIPEVKRNIFGKIIDRYELKGVREGWVEFKTLGKTVHIRTNQYIIRQSR
jgi:hypothetical protein